MRDPKSLSPLGTKEEVQNRLKGHVFKPIKGGYQIKTVYLSDDLVVSIPKRRTPIYWDEEMVQWLESKPAIRPFYVWARRRNSFMMFHLKQGLKYLLALVSRSPAAGPFAMVSTLNGYRLAQKLDGLMDPFVILDRVEIRTDRHSKRVLSPVIIRERSDETLLDELRELVRLGKVEEAKERTEEAMRLDEKIWEKQLCNIDFSFKNDRIRHGKVVLRDGGNVSENYREIIHFIETLHGLHGEVEEKCHPIRKNIKRLALFSKNLSDYFQKRASEIYTIKNFNRCWFKQGETQDTGHERQNG